MPASPTRLLALLLLISPGSKAFAQGYPAEEAASRMTVADGLKARLVAWEPLVRQPVAIEFDDRGRLWVVQYLQYPNPEGLSRVEVDRYSRTKYDRIPEPPPRGPKGGDRITILDDTDGDGRMDRARDFVEGLNLASGLAFGDGGVYVLNVPYLLFYADRDLNDVPDGDPEVLLTGFGMEDAHSVANSLTWGPDGWLYGLQGSTVTANIRGIEFQQGVWRYHPKSKRFELFAEGGGNMWGLDFDPRGQLFASTNVGGNVMLHFVQGGSYWKLFSKHGGLHHPYAFGYFEHVPHEGVRGGHVSVGGLFYQADAWPERYRGAYLAADLLDHGAHLHAVEPVGSTFRARQTGDLLLANDTWFAPSDMTLGPDGSVYLTDWHDRRTAHPDPDADWDRTNGRIFAIDGPKRLSPENFDLASATPAQLVSRLDHPNVWHARRALRRLREVDAASVAPVLRKALADSTGPRALRALWALNAVGAVDESTALGLLNHSDADVRAWVVRFVGDDPKRFASAVPALAALAEREPSVVTRAQLACTARRLDPQAARPILTALLRRDLDADDPYVPLLVWWGIERGVETPGSLDAWIGADLWRSRLYRSTIPERLIRRAAAEKKPEWDDAIVGILNSAPAAETKSLLLVALDEATRGRDARSISTVLKAAIARLVSDSPDDPARFRLAARFDVGDARDRVLQTLAAPERSQADRRMAISLIGETGDPAAVGPLLHLATSGDSIDLKLAALDALGRLDDASIPTKLLNSLANQPAEWQARARDLLLSRKAWAMALLDAVENKKVDPAGVPLAQVQRFATLGDPEIDRLVRRHWGQVSGPTPEAKLAEVRRLNNDLRATTGDPMLGRAVFRTHCASCHRLHGEGELVGPELTHANRQDRDFLLVSLVDPSSVIRKDYQAVVVHTKSGQVLGGLILAQTPESITLVMPDGSRQTLARSEVEETLESPTSLMPEDLYRRLSPAELRDLFAYLQAEKP